MVGRVWEFWRERVLSKSGVRFWGKIEGEGYEFWGELVRFMMGVIMGFVK